MSSSPLWRDTLKNGLWQQNPGLVQILGLCPILAVSTSVVNAASLGLATMLVMVLSSAAVASVRHWIAPQVRIPVFILLIAGLVTVLELIVHAWFYGLHKVLGIFIPLITTNCIVLARVETFAAKHTPAQAALDAFAMGLGLVWVLALLGGLRELIGAGTLFAGIEMVCSGLRGFSLFGDDYPGFLPALLPPGAFILLGLIVAGYNALRARAEVRQPAPQQAAAANA